MANSVLNQRKEAVFTILFLVCFSLVAYYKGFLQGINVEVNIWSASINTGFFTGVAKAISVAFDTIPLLGVTVVIAVFLFILHHRRQSILLLGAMAGDALLVEFLKTIIASPRPTNAIVLETGYSFPSGHTTSSVVLFGILIYFAWSHWKTTKVRALTGSLYVSEVAIIGFDRIYLNVHWFTDILGAVFLGVFWVTFCIWIIKPAISSKIKNRPELNQKSAETSSF